MDVCGWCGFTRTGTPREHEGATYCHGPGVPERTCWQIATADGAVVEADFGHPLTHRGNPRGSGSQT